MNHPDVKPTRAGVILHPAIAAVAFLWVLGGGGVVAAQECGIELVTTANVDIVSACPGVCEGKITEITFKYTGEGCGASKHEQGKKGVCVGGASFQDLVVDMTARRKKNNDAGIPAYGVPLDGYVTFSGLDSSETTVTIADPAGNVLEENTIHTSCSRPIAPGDQFGSLVVIAFSSKKGGLVSGGEVEYTYTVTNMSTAAAMSSPATVDEVSVTDDQGGLIGVISSVPLEGETLTDVRVLTVTTTSTATATLTAGVDHCTTQPVHATVTVVAPPEGCGDPDLSGDEVVHDDGSDETHDSPGSDAQCATGAICSDACPCEPSTMPTTIPPAECGIDLVTTASVDTVTACPGVCEGKITDITFKYTGEGCGASDHEQGKKAVCVAGASLQDPVDVTARKKNDPGVTVIGVPLDGYVTFSGLDSSETTVTIADPAGSVIEANTIHTSCSRPIGPGDKFGSLTVIAFTSRKGGLVSGGEVEYTYTVTNMSGTAAADGVSVTDDQLGLIGVIPSVPPDESVILTDMGVLTASTINTATATRPVGVDHCTSEPVQAAVTVVEPPAGCNGSAVCGDGVVNHLSEQCDPPGRPAQCAAGDICNGACLCEPLPTTTTSTTTTSTTTASSTTTTTNLGATTSSAECEEYCRLWDTLCAVLYPAVYANAAECEAACATYPDSGWPAPGDPVPLSGDTVQCRVIHLRLFESEDPYDPDAFGSEECLFASPSGTGPSGEVCTDTCDEPFYCDGFFYGGS